MSRNRLRVHPAGPRLLMKSFEIPQAQDHGRRDRGLGPGRGGVRGLDPEFHLGAGRETGKVQAEIPEELQGDSKARTGISVSGPSFNRASRRCG